MALVCLWAAATGERGCGGVSGKAGVQQIEATASFGRTRAGSTRALLGVQGLGASADEGGRCRQHKRRLGTSGGDRCVVAATEERRRPRQNCSSVGSLQFDPEAFVKLAGRQTRFYALALRSGPRQVTEEALRCCSPASQGSVELE